jgi:hypothetical protein
VTRPRLGWLGPAAVLVACAAFLGSFLLGLRVPASPTHAGDAATAAAPAGLPTSTAPAGGARVEVLNGSGRPGVARAATDRLRAAGFDVVYFGNAGSFSGDSSRVLARTDSDLAARAAGRALGIADIRTQRDSTLLVDATVIVGPEWPQEAVAAEPAAVTWRGRVARWLRPGR